MRRRFATEVGFTLDNVRLDDSRRVWRERLEQELSPEELGRFPDIPLAPLSRTITERVRDTTVFISADTTRGIHAARDAGNWTLPV